MANNYWESELSGIMTTGSNDVVKVKFQTMHTDTKWLSLRPSEYEAVETLLVALYAQREQDDSRPWGDGTGFTGTPVND